jgi:hypothetical protein
MKPTRREFLTAAAVAPALGPILLGVQDKTGAKPPVLGEGAYTYEAIHDWGELPSHIKWGNTHNVVEDAQGNIYVHHTVHATSESGDSVVVFDRNGKFVRSFGKEYRGVAHGMWLQKEGSSEFLYFTVNAANARMQPQPELPSSVVKATLRGEIVFKIQGPPDIPEYKVPEGAPQPNLPLYNPTNIAIGPTGDLYVADGYGSYYINRYNSKGKYLSTFGGRGSDPGQLKEPHGIWMDNRSGSPILMVTDRRNNRLQRFTPEGKFIDFVTDLRLPSHFHERNGIVVVADLQTRVTLLDRNNQAIVHLGDPTPASPPNPNRGTQDRSTFVPGQFVNPHGAIFDREGNIFVAEWVEIGRLTKLRKVA